jgi:hypothetical protein
MQGCDDVCGLSFSAGDGDSGYEKDAALGAKRGYEKGL